MVACHVGVVLEVTGRGYNNALMVVYEIDFQITKQQHRFYDRCEMMRPEWSKWVLV